MKHTKFRMNWFHDIDDLNFLATEYSQMKFGSDKIAKKYGYELATTFFQKHIDVLLSNSCVVIPSPYNHVENAATIMTKHFVDKINELLTNVNGEHVQFSTIHRKVTYTSDYGFLSKEKRKGLINNDSFYFNDKFIEGKLLIFIDDVCITGAHEEKLIDVMKENKIDNECFFLYYGQYNGASPEIEAQLNFAGIKSPNTYLNLLTNERCHIIVRTIKYILGLEGTEFKKIIPYMSIDHLERIYYGALGEGYYKIPSYQKNLELIKGVLNK